MFEEYKKVHFVGIGGIGISALAKMMHLLGISVTGSDTASTEITRDVEREGIKIFVGHDAGNVQQDAELIVYSEAVPKTNPEREAAAELGIAQKSYPEMLGEISRKHKTIAVAGTNGKSTTTAMIGLILEAAGLDPTVIVGSRIPTFEHGNLRMGQSNLFVVEACEYRASMLNISPDILVVTNIEEDHLDYYRDLDHIVATFQQMVDRLGDEGILIWNADDEPSRRLKPIKAAPFACGSDALYRCADRRISEGRQHFKLMLQKGNKLQVLAEDIALSVPGEFNVMNAMAAIAASLQLGVPLDVIADSLQNFSGIWRRFERLGKFQGAELISDYGHISSAIEGTVRAAREFFPGRRIVLCFQPHQHDRTKKLFDDFVDALAKPDITVVSEIYGVAGRTEDDKISGKDLVEAIREKYPQAKVFFTKDFAENKKKLEQIVQEGDVLIIQGAGDIDELARELA